VVPRLAQECNSIFVETGNGDSFIFDIGSGVSAKYNAMGIPYSRMTKVFLTHLHGDHTSDIITLYCFGPSLDRRQALNVWGPAGSGLPDPKTGEIIDDGTVAFCTKLKELMYWHEQSFSFLQTGLGPGNDGYDINATELPWATVGGTAYENDGVKITHFPAVHARNGAISYRLDWNGLSMIFSGDTKPNDFMISQAEYAWYAPTKTEGLEDLAPPLYPTPVAQLSEDLLSHSIDESVYENPPVKNSG